MNYIARLPKSEPDFQLARRIGYAPTGYHLQGRLLQIAQLVALGLADKEIAHLIGVSQATVKAHVSGILKLLALHRRAQIARYVYERRLLPDVKAHA